MSERYTEVIKTRVPPSLAHKVEETATQTGHSVSSLVRYILGQWLEPDKITLEQCARLVDPGGEYETEGE